MINCVGDNIVKRTRLKDGTKVHCLVSTEAIVLDDHVEGYFNHGIRLSDGDIVFDVGANIGIFGIRTVQMGDSIRVFAFEPIPTIYKCLKQNAKVFAPDRFIALDCGVSDYVGTAEFSYYPNSPALSTSKPEQWDEESLVNAVDGSLKNPPKHMWYIQYLPKFVSKWFAHRMRLNAEQFTCQLRTVSSIIEEYDLSTINLLKVDCEGAELECLLGIDEQHWHTIQQVVMEVHDTDGTLEKILTLLDKMGLTNQVIEQEKALVKTNLYNIFAHREQE